MQTQGARQDRKRGITCGGATLSCRQPTAEVQPSSVRVPAMMPGGVAVATDRRRRRDRIGGLVDVVDSEQAFDAADRAADGTADDGANRTGNATALIEAVRGAAGNALRLRRHRQAQQGYAGDHDMERADARTLKNATNTHELFSDSLLMSPGAPKQANLFNNLAAAQNPGGRCSDDTARSARMMSSLALSWPDMCVRARDAGAQFGHGNTRAACATPLPHAAGQSHLPPLR